jgi:hypothetical protein
MQAPDSPKRSDVVDLTVTETKSPSSILGKRASRSDDTESEPQPPAAKQAKFTDCSGCIVIVGVTDEPNDVMWLKVPEAAFNTDLQPLAQRYGFKGESMLQYLQQACCAYDDDVGNDDEDEVSEGNALTALFDAWSKRGYNLLKSPKSVGEAAPGSVQLTNVKYLVSVDLFEG